jgi:hypothetical protein
VPQLVQLPWLCLSIETAIFWFKSSPDRQRHGSIAGVSLIRRMPPHEELPREKSDTPIEPCLSLSRKALYIRDIGRYKGPSNFGSYLQPLDSAPFTHPLSAVHPQPTHFRDGNLPHHLHHRRQVCRALQGSIHSLIHLQLQQLQQH